MTGLVFFAAALIPQEEIIKQLREAIDDYLVDPTDHNYDHVGSLCKLLLAKRMVKDDLGQAIKTTQDFDKSVERDRLFKTDEN